jgi:hypothetical protein
MLDSHHITGETPKECEECSTKLYDNTPYYFNRKKDYICPKCISVPRILSFILVWFLILIPLPGISWAWVIKVIALIYMARLLQSFVVCLPYFLKLKK